MRLEDLINKNYSHLNENDLYIWDYISKHRHECEKLSIDKLADKCHVSRSTVLRFSKRLGLKGYSELKVLLKIDNDTTKSNALNDNVYENYLKTLDHIKDSQYLDIVKAIYHSKNVYIYGTGVIQETIVQHIKRVFLRIGELFLDIDNNADIEAYLDLFDQDDIFIGVTYSGENRQLIDYVERLKAKGILVVIISARNESTLSRLADYSLYIKEFRIPTNLKSYESLLGSYFVLVDFLFVNYINYALNKGVE